MYFQNAEAAIIVYDVTNELSFEKAEKWSGDVTDEESSGGNKILKFLVGNKSDLDHEK